MYFAGVVVVFDSCAEGIEVVLFKQLFGLGVSELGLLQSMSELGVGHWGIVARRNCSNGLRASK